MYKASIDIGSNSILLLIADVKDNKVIHTIVNEQRVTALGKNIDLNKKFSKESMDDSYQALEEYKELLLVNNINLNSVIVTATEAARVVSNSEVFFEKIKNELGFFIQIISGEEEALYTAKGVVSGESELDKFVVIDIGGASTEFVLVDREPFKIIRSISLPFGVVRGTSWLEQNVLETKLRNILDESSLERFENQQVVGVAGTFTSLTAMISELSSYQDELVHGQSISKKQLKELSNSILDLNPDQILEQYNFLGKRSAVIKAGLLISLYLMEEINISNLKISTFGLRYGTLLNLSQD